MSLLNAGGGSWVAGSSFDAPGGTVVVRGVLVAYFAFPTLGGVVLYESLDTASVVLSGLIVLGLSSNHGDLSLRAGTAAVLLVMGGL